jgi:hypothetical protein
MSPINYVPQAIHVVKSLIVYCYVIYLCPIFQLLAENHVLCPVNDVPPPHRQFMHVQSRVKPYPCCVSCRLCPPKSSQATVTTT